MRWLHADVAPAWCLGPAGRARTSAQGVFVGVTAVPAALSSQASAAAAADAPPGHIVCAGRFDCAEAHAALAAQLGRELAARLRRGFEWYVCRGARFHSDAHYAGVLFGAWCIQGPPRDVVFARLGLRAAAAPGAWVVFDPFEPHAVLDDGASEYEPARYAAAPPSVFVGFEITLDEALLGAIAARGGSPRLTLSSRSRIDPETGAIVD